VRRTGSLVRTICSAIYTIAIGTKPLGTTALAVLGLLAYGERSGYDLIQSAERSVGFIWRPAKRNVYNVLPRLVEEGLAVRREVTQSGRPTKHLYRITKAGRDALRRWLEELGSNEPDREAVFLLKVFFGRFTDREVVARQVEAYREYLKEKRGTYKEIETRIATDPAGEFPYLTLRYGIAQAEASIRWADAALRRLGPPS
jgi:PadR family transcriptional regulator, regulatory protein AphA